MNENWDIFKDFDVAILGILYCKQLVVDEVTFLLLCNFESSRMNTSIQMISPKTYVSLIDRSYFRKHYFP